MVEELKAYTNMMREGYFPSWKSLLIDTGYPLLILFSLIFFIGGWALLFFLPFELMMLSGKPRFITKYISVHWNKMYKLKDKLDSY